MTIEEWATEWAAFLDTAFVLGLEKSAECFHAWRLSRKGTVEAAAQLMAPFRRFDDAALLRRQFEQLHNGLICPCEAMPFQEELLCAECTDPRPDHIV